MLVYTDILKNLSLPDPFLLPIDLCVIPLRVNLLYLKSSPNVDYFINIFDCHYNG